MSKYNTSRANYRKIYEQNFGPIPKDQDGVSFDIHHQDGNRNNNDPSNLIALSRHDHYHVHLSQGDYYAALRIAQRLSLGHDTQSQLARKANLERVRLGIHQFLGGKIHRMLVSQGRWHASGPQCNQRRVENGTHPWLGGEVSRRVTTRRLEDGTHNFLLMTTEERRERQNRLVRQGRHHFCGKTNPVYKQLADGTHNFLGGEIQRRHNRRRVADGTHHLLGGAKQRQTIIDGTHSSCIKVECPHCHKIGSKPALKATHFDYCKQNPNQKSRPIVSCPHCSATGTKHALCKSHFDYCKHNPNRVQRVVKPVPKIQCSHCIVIGDPGNMKKHHFNNCKKRPLACT